MPSSETSCPPPRRIKRNGSIEADSSTALRVMQLVSQVASLGTTVVCSVHQPRPEVVRLIDKVRRLVTLFMSCHVVSSHVLSRHVLSRHVLSCHVMSCLVMSRHVMSCHVISCHVMLERTKRTKGQHRTRGQSSLQLFLQRNYFVKIMMFEMTKRRRESVLVCCHGYGHTFFWYVECFRE